ncbi:hypothetical protein CA11_46580 [Gimesia maris]|nr:hypothetical protein CA11_46580 [Gimesia maris]
MSWERTLLTNLVSESDAPTKRVKAYLSNLVLQMLYAVPHLPLAILLCFGSSLHLAPGRENGFTAGINNTNVFWSFLQLFHSSIAIGIS